MGQASDVDLLAASARGRLDAFEQLVERHQALVRAVCFSRTGDWAVSEDLAQETFLVAWSDLGKLREPSRLRAWLCGIARNLSLKALRIRGREVPLEAAEAQVAEGSPLEAALERETQELVWGALERIPGRYREALVLFYQEGRSAGEVAEAMGISEGAVHQRLSRGRRYLKDSVEDIVERSLSQRRPDKAFVAGIIATIEAGTPGAAKAGVGVTAGVTAMSWMKIGGATVVAAALAALWWSSGSGAAEVCEAPPSAEAAVALPSGPRGLPQSVSAVAPPAARSPVVAPARPAAAHEAEEPATEEDEVSAGIGLELRGVEQDWAEGRMGAVLEPCLGLIGDDVKAVTFALSAAEGRIEGARAVDGDALGPRTTEVERCVAQRLRDFGVKPRPGEAAELELKVPEPKGPPPWDRDAFEALDLSTFAARGPDTAQVTMVVFTGLRCVFCGRHLGTIDQLMDEYPTQLRVVVRPIALLEEDKVVTEAAYAARAQGRFWPMHDAMHADQDHLQPDAIRTYAEAAGLDLARFDADMASRTFKEQVELEAKEAIAMGVMGMPTTVLGGERISGAQPIEVFRAKIDALLGAR
ncbi:MAG: sigma-70 family RNA polymerase sigma factor [Deltaproteobacteria bacterium]|nr:sigma-70 family RNA polymerase sigma factor [Deltaproteobacteria bacterium]